MREQTNQAPNSQSFETGAVRGSQKGKLRFDLLSPIAQERLVLVLTDGANRYGDRNWEKGIPLMRCVASLQRHLHSFLLGEQDEDHLGHLLANAHFLADLEFRIGDGQLPASLDDRPKYDRDRPIERIALEAPLVVGSWPWADRCMRLGLSVRTPRLPELEVAFNPVPSVEGYALNSCANSIDSGWISAAHRTDVLRKGNDWYLGRQIRSLIEQCPSN